MRKWLSGQPTVLIEKGKLLDKNMKKLNITVDDLNQQLREKGVFNIFEVEYALLEISGEISIYKKNAYQGIIKKDLNLPNKSVSFPIELIMDGKIIQENINGMYNSEWIKAECRKRNLQVENIYYAVINTNGELFVDQYDDKLSSPADVE